MTTSTQKYLLITLLLGFSLPVQAEPKDNTLVVVVSKQSPVYALTLIEIRRIFLAEITYAAGEPALPLNLPPGSPERTAFDQAVLNMSQERAGRYWIDRKVRGQGVPPKSLPSATLIQRVAAKHPEVITYCFASDLSPDVRPVLVDGQAYNLPTYPLRQGSDNVN